MKTHEKELDNLLFFIDRGTSRNTFRPSFTFTDLRKEIEEEKPDLGGNENPNNSDELGRMLKKLIKDGFIDIDVTENDTTFSMSWDGRLFKGYVNEKNLKAKKETKEDRRSSLLVWATVVVAFDTVLNFAKFLHWIYNVLHK
jgi:hypothetical protein